MEYAVSYCGMVLANALFGQLHPGVQFTSPVLGPLNNWAGFSDETYTRLSTAIYAEADPARQKQVYAQWNDFLLDSSHVVVISSVTPRVAMQPNVRNAAFNMSSMFDVGSAWLA
jgi:ABC-type transport system substrate-binding protein